MRSDSHEDPARPTEVAQPPRRGRPPFPSRALLRPRNWPLPAVIGHGQLIAVFPLAARRNMGRHLGWLLARNAKLRHATRRNLAVCLPRQSPEARAHFERAAMAEMAASLLAVVRTWFAFRPDDPDIADAVRYAGRVHLDAALDSGRPIPLLNAHLNSTELNLALTGRLPRRGRPLMVAYRAPSNRAADAVLVARHVANVGISLHRKFTHFLDTILPEHVPGALPGRDGPGLEALLDTYAQAVRDGLMSCPVAEGVTELRAATAGARWCIVSSGDKAELRKIFAARGLDRLFDGGIFGSRDSKNKILSGELAAEIIRRPALFLGDSRYDHEAATRAGLDFVFVSGWCEVLDWQSFVSDGGIRTIQRIADLLASEEVPC